VRIPSQLSLFLLLTLPLFSVAQEVTGYVHDVQGQPLVGASVYWSVQNDGGTYTEVDGTFKLPLAKGLPADLVVSYVGYVPDTMQIKEAGSIDIELRSRQDMDVVVVTENRQGSFISTINPVKTEVITAKELGRSACCDLAGCFNTQGSVHPTTTNIVTNAKELRILGLSGVYNQVLIDGFPLIQGLSYTYGISSIPGTLIKSIFVAKGANSVLQGYESISGQINVVLKQPDEDERLLLNVYLNSFGEHQYNLNYTQRWDNWSTLLAAHTTQPAQRNDRDEDEFLDLPLLTRYTVYNKWKYRDAGEWGLYSETGLRFVQEQRIGGQVSFEPDQDKGTTNAYGQLVEYSQPEIYTKTGYRLDDYHHILFYASGFYQKQESYYGTTHYQGTHANAYLNLQYEYNWRENHQLKTGFSYRFLDLEEDISFGNDDLQRSYAGIYQRQENIPGVFAENVFNWYDSQLTLITGFRYDHHNDFGWKATPRVLLRANLSPATVARISAGTGWRTVNLFSENINLLASSRDVRITEELLPEEAINYGANLTHNYYGDDVEAQFSFDFYRTVFQNQIFPDYDTDPTVAIVRNFTGTSISNGFQGELGLAFYQRFGVKLAYNYLDVYRVVDGEKQVLPFNATHRVVASFSYEPLSKGWHFDANVHWTGEQRLANTASSPPEFQQEEYADPFTVINAQFTKAWTKLEIYAGCENIFDFRQLRPIRSWQDPFGPYFDTANVWGPTRGREFYVGVRYRIEE
jgi:outer membrane receptor for ferrienterochelin and colicin